MAVARPLAKCIGDFQNLRRDSRKFGVRNYAKCRDKKFCARAPCAGSAGELTTESASARHSMEQSVEVPGDGMQPHALRQLALDIRDQTSGRFLR